MAEVLIRNESVIDGDHTTLQAGDPVDVKPDGFKWGRNECRPLYHVVLVPGVLVSDLHYLLEPKLSGICNINGEFPIVQQRRYRMPIPMVKSKIQITTVLKSDFILK